MLSSLSAIALQRLLLRLLRYLLSSPCACLLFDPDARVNHCIEDVSDEVPYYGGHREQDGGRLNHGIISVVNRGDGGISDAGDIEDIFNEECSGDQQANGEAKDRNKWNQGVAERVSVRKRA
jgi:hypothetical protein